MYHKLSILAAVVPIALAAFKEGCSEANWNSTTDYFLHKFEDDPSSAFFADYHNTYLTVRNHAGFAVLHCTDEKPPLSAFNGDEDTLFIKVPVKNVAALDGFSQNLIDMLGQSSSIKRVGKYEDITSSCLRGLSYENKTYDDSNWDKAEPVDVTFYGNNEPNNMSQVMVYPHYNSPLGTLSFIKMISLFYGLEERAEEIYNSVAANYRCAATVVQDRIMNNNYAEGALISVVERKGNGLIAWANDYWQILATDAGVRLVNATDTAGIQDRSQGNYWNITGDDVSSKVAKESWAIIDVSQYFSSPDSRFGVDRNAFPDRLNTKTYIEKSGLDKDIYALEHENVFLTDKATNRNLKHDFNDRGPARPDYVLFDLISKIQPDLTKDIYTANFLRPINNPDDAADQLSNDNACYPSDNPIKALNLTKCELPKWAKGYHAAGVKPNAYSRDNTVKSLALPSVGSLSTGTKAGISVGSIIGGLLLIGTIIFLILRLKRNKMAKQAEGPVAVTDIEKNQVRKGSHSTISA